MKKERTNLFPEITLFSSDKTADEKVTVRPGNFLKIRKPSNRYYKAVYHSLKFGEHQLGQLQKLSQVTYEIVRVVSVLRMKNGTSLAVLRKPDETPFYGQVLKLFADIEEGVACKELVPISLEEEALLKQKRYEQLNLKNEK